MVCSVDSKEEMAVGGSSRSSSKTDAGRTRPDGEVNACWAGASWSFTNKDPGRECGARLFSVGPFVYFSTLLVSAEEATIPDCGACSFLLAGMIPTVRNNRSCVAPINLHPPKSHVFVAVSSLSLGRNAPPGNASDVLPALPVQIGIKQK
jgi:hypothetical protein